MKTKNIRTNFIPTSIDLDNKTIDFVMTAEVADRDGDIVDIDTINLDNFLANPVVLPSHNNKEKVIGRVLEIKKEIIDDIKSLIGTVQFAVGLTKEADEYWGLYSEGFQKAVSIGFSSPRGEQTDTGFRMFDSELLELSLVSIPANQIALAKSAKKICEDFEDIDATKRHAKDLLIELKSIFEEEEESKEEINEEQETVTENKNNFSKESIKKAQEKLRTISLFNKTIRSIKKNLA